MARYTKSFTQPVYLKRIEIKCERWTLDSIELARTITKLLEEKKGEDILLLDISEVSDFSDYFVICSGTSERMIEALASDIVKHLRNKNKVRGKVEGLPQDGWILVDYGPVLMHIFSPEKRTFYNLEELWSDGQVLLHLQ